MITKLTVESFKSLESVEVHLGRVNVFIGANGSGKSNLLEALGVLGAAAFGRVDDESLLRRGVRPGLPRLYKSSFPRREAEKRPHIFFGAEDGSQHGVSRRRSFVVTGRRLLAALRAGKSTSILSYCSIRNRA